LTCQGSDQCEHAMKSERVSLEMDRRIFTPIARSSYAWEREYKKRTAVERVNSRFDVSLDLRSTLSGDRERWRSEWAASV